MQSIFINKEKFFLNIDFFIFSDTLEPNINNNKWDDDDS